jgi:hypothetical protein
MGAPLLIPIHTHKCLYSLKVWYKSTYIINVYTTSSNCKFVSLKNVTLQCWVLLAHAYTFIPIPILLLATLTGRKGLVDGILNKTLSNRIYRIQSCSLDLTTLCHSVKRVPGVSNRMLMRSARFMKIHTPISVER